MYWVPPQYKCVGFGYSNLNGLGSSKQKPKPKNKMNTSTNSGEFEVFANFENRQNNLGVFVGHLLKRAVALAAVTAVVAVVGSVANRLRYKADLKKVEADRQKALKKVARDAKKAKKSAEKEESVVASGITKANTTAEETSKYKWAH